MGPATEVSEIQDLHCAEEIMKMCNQVGHYQQNDKKTVINCTRSTVSVQLAY